MPLWCAWSCPWPVLPNDRNTVHLRALFLRNFRNHVETTLSLPEGISLIVGNNGVGKTSVLEALQLLSIGRSFRALSLPSLMRTGSSGFFLKATFERDDVPQCLSFAYQDAARKMTHNETTLPSLSSLFGLMPVVLSLPQDLLLIKGAPSLRRRFIDLHLSQIFPAYMYALARYFGAMEQRNILLKQRAYRSMDVWEFEMSRHAITLIKHRREAIAQLSATAASFYQKLSGFETASLSLTYHGSLRVEDPIESTCAFAKRLHETRERESLLGHTLFGPHKDEMSIRIGNEMSKWYASDGEQRSALVALRLAQWEQVQQQGLPPPLMLVDDFGIGLDTKRRHLLAIILAGLPQTLITSTDPQSLGHAPHHSIALDR